MARSAGRNGKYSRGASRGVDGTCRGVDGLRTASLKSRCYSYALRRIAGSPRHAARHRHAVVSSSSVWRPAAPSTRSSALPPQVRANLERLYGLDRPLPRAVPALSRGAWCTGISGPRCKLRDFTVRELIAPGTAGERHARARRARAGARLLGMPLGIVAARCARPRRRLSASAPPPRSPSRCRASSSGRCWRSSSALHLHWLPVGRLGGRRAARTWCCRCDARAAGGRVHGAADARRACSRCCAPATCARARARGLGERARAVAPRAAAGAAAGGELPRARGGLRRHRARWWWRPCSGCPARGAIWCRARSTATTRSSWA